MSVLGYIGAVAASSGQVIPCISPGAASEPPSKHTPLALLVHPCNPPKNKPRQLMPWLPLPLQRTAKLRAEWEQRTAQASGEERGGNRRGRVAHEDDWGREGVRYAGRRGDRYEGGSRRGYERDVDDDRYDGRRYGMEEEEEEVAHGRRGGRNEPPSSSRRSQHYSGRLAGRLEMPEGVYFRDEEAPDRCVYVAYCVCASDACVHVDVGVGVGMGVGACGREGF